MVEPLRASVCVWLALAPASASAQGFGLEQLRHHMDWGTEGLVLVDKLEVGVGYEETPIALEAIGWYGGAVDRAWFRAEADQLTGDTSGDLEAHAYYGRLIAPFWDLLAGVRFDGRWGERGDARGHLALGLVGLAPFRFELAPTLFASHEGDISARLEAEYQLQLTQRMIAEPEIELNVAFTDASDWGVGRGFEDVELGLRLRYEIVRELAPYVGVEWDRALAGTADLARRAGEPVSDVALVTGVRAWR